ncbi:C-C chemokine receptor type 10 [Pangasianodon hypophthalmus]|uniref:C-C chemokine receptor type 10 n=1 Tax=Pangasianodon hypophthalmus TaxID=310915 RepID=UPI000EFF8EE9|nr:C-C chemokine receptor type 10 [Pangasianodon hypophthalmus]
MYGNSNYETSTFGNVTPDYIYDYGNCTGNYCDLNVIEICEPDNRQELTIMAVQVTVFLIAFFLGVIGNSLVIATFTKYRRLRLRCMTDVFLFYLAISDLLLLLTLPLETSEIIIGSWKVGNELCKLNHGLCAINTYGGLLLLACISIDRYLLVVRARTAQALRPSMLCYSKLSAIAVAVTSIVLSLPELISTSVHQSSLRCEYVGNEGDNGRVKMWARVAKITGFCVPCIAMLVCYSIISYVLMQGRGKCFRRQKTLRLIVALILLFLLFQLPYAMVLSLRLFMSDYSCKLWNDIHLAEDVTRSLAYVRCCLNPLLYALVGVRFRNDVMRLLIDCSCICPYLSLVTSKLDYGSSMTPSSPPPTSTLMPFSDVYSPKILPDTAKIENPAGMPQVVIIESYSPNIFFPSDFPNSQKPGDIVVSTYTCQ